MRGTTFAVSTEFVIEECCNCGIAFGLTRAFKSECQKKRGPSGKRFYCPNGHDQFYVGETEADKLRRERDSLAQRVAEWQDEAGKERSLREEAERSAAAFKGQATKLRKRAANGVCPCCTRSFTNLQRHMATKHPTFAADAVDSGRQALNQKDKSDDR